MWKNLLYTNTLNCTTPFVGKSAIHINIRRGNKITKIKIGLFANSKLSCGSQNIQKFY